MQSRRTLLASFVTLLKLTNESAQNVDTFADKVTTTTNNIVAMGGTVRVSLVTYIRSECFAGSSMTEFLIQHLMLEQHAGLTPRGITWQEGIMSLQEHYTSLKGTTD